jgi:signal transduction histidine kinase
MALAVMAEERDRHEQALSSVNRRLIEAHEEERTWIARELHDDFSQRVALVSLSIDRLEQALPGSELRARAYTEELKEQLRELGNDIHALSHRLHSSKLQFLGLAAACKGFCRELSERQSVEIEFCSEGIPADLPSEISLSLFRVLQEALQNAVKHSGVRTFFVSLVSASNEIELCVRDSGTGFDPERAASEHGLGLTSMKERLNLVDGRFSIDSKVGQGTTIKAWVSLTQQANPRSNSKVASAVTTSAPSES